MPSKFLWLAALAGLGLATLGVYWPGLAGPFLFDDDFNILQNAALRLDRLSAADLIRAAWSQESGTLQRPVAYLSFALNHYAAGGFDPFPFKATNLGVHLLCAVLVAALAWRLAATPLADQPCRRYGFAVLAAALFALHPLALSPVLYVVQRMASLSTLFVLAAVLCWLNARVRWAGAATYQVASRNPKCAPRLLKPLPQPVAQAASAGGTSLGTESKRWSPLGWFLAGVLFWVLGLFTKENAALLPLLYLAANRVCFADAPYWRWLARTGHGGFLARLALWLLAAVAAGLVAWYAAPGYAARPFTLTERLLTESRVMWFYIGLFVFPRINAFGLYHDDIALSTGLLTPWTTLPALLGLAALVWLGLRLLRTAPLVGFGLLWFLAGHLMESTLLPLEIAHEHRNYLPMVGLVCASAWLLTALAGQALRAGVTASAAVLLVLGTTTALRAGQWHNKASFARYEVAHHPNSARARGDLASELAQRGDFEGAQTEAQAAAGLAPDEVGYHMNVVNTIVVQGKTPAAESQVRIESLLANHPLSPYGTLTFKHYSECIERSCKHMAPYLARWLDMYLNSGQPTFDKAYAWHMKGLSLRAAGDLQGALNAFERAHALDPNYLHPLFEQANIFLALRQWDNAAFNLRRLEAANRTAPVRQDQALAELAAAIAKGRSGQ